MEGYPIRCLGMMQWVPHGLVAPVELLELGFERFGDQSLIEAAFGSRH
jgi:hypothetical protein